MKILSLQPWQIAGIASFYLAIAAECATPPPVTNEAPAAGKRVRVTPPEWTGTNVYHTLYLPSDWVAGNTYPVIVEWAPNSSGGTAGTVEDTHLGFYQSGGAGFIWVTMPFPTTATSPASNATMWWGVSQDTAADYTRINLARILENYGGDPAAVFATGFSRGSLAIGHIGHWNDQIADIWLGYLPLGQLDGFNWTTEGDEAARFARMSGRASFVTYGENDGFSNVPASTPAGITAMQNAGFPVEWHKLAATGHTDEWITDANGAVASINEPAVTDVRARLRAWLSETIANRPGTSGISGAVTDSGGSPIAGARIQSGATHWTFSDSSGNYVLPSLIDGSREVVVSHPSYTFPTPTLNVVLAGADLAGQNFAGGMVVSLPPVLGTPATTAITHEGATVSSPLSQAPSTTSTLVWAHSDQGETDVGTWTGASGGGSVSLGSANPGDVLSHVITGLADGTQYFYRFHAANGFGSAWSAAGNFTTTLAVAPALGNPTVSGITFGQATASSSLSQASCDSCTLVWAHSDQGASNVATWTSAPGGGSVSIGTANPGDVLSGLMSGLDPSTSYSCRFFAQNIHGSSWSAAGTFTTLAEPDIVTPIAAVATSQLGAGYEATQLVNGNGLSGAGPILTQTHVTVTSNGAFGYWLGTTSVAQEIVFTLAAPADLSAAFIWQYTRTSTTWNLRGVKTFNISFSTDGGSSYGTPVAGSLAVGQMGNPSDEMAQTVSFAPQTGVTHVKFSNLANFPGSDGWFALAEVRFGGSSGPVPLALNPPAASNVGFDRAMLSTSVNAAVDAVTLYWGTTDHGATPAGWTGSLSLGGYPAGAINHLLTGLAENTTYFFRFHAGIISPAEEAWSAAGTFTTPFENPPVGTIITPVGVTGHSANTSGFPTINLINGSGMSGGGDVLTQTHAPSTGTGANPAWIGGISQLNSSQPLVFNLGGTYDIDAVHVWQYTDTASATFNNFGTSAFNISFSTDGGVIYGTPISLSGFTQGTQTHESVQTRTFAVQSGVTHIKFNNFSAFNGATNAGLSEVRFGGSSGPVPLALDPPATSNVEFDRAMLSTSVNAAVDTVTLYWDTTDHGASPAGWTGSLSLGGYPAGAINHLLTGLAENTTYFFRFHAGIISPAQEAWSAAGTFTTPFDNPPAGSILTPSGVTATSSLSAYPIVNTINSSGLNSSGPSALDWTHVATPSNSNNFSWLGTKAGTVIIYQLPAPSTVDSLLFWSYWGGTASRSLTAFDISFSSDGVTYSTPSTITLGTPGSAAEFFSLGTHANVTHVRFANLQNGGDSLAGIGEVRFGGQPSPPGGPFDGWTAGPWSGTLTDDSPTLDFDGGGLETGIEWVVGGDPTAAGDDAGNAPTLDNGNATHFIFTFKRRDAAATDANTGIAVEYGSNLGGWVKAVHGTNGVTIDDSTDLGGGFHQVTVSIPRALAVDGKLFARLKATVTTTP